MCETGFSAVYDSFVSCLVSSLRTEHVIRREMRLCGENMAKRLILCDCLKSQTLDAKAIESATGLACSRIHTNLCGAELEDAARAMAEPGTIIACRQESQRFEELAAELDLPEPAFFDLRDSAGWSDEAAKALPKMAALAALAALDEPPTKFMDVVSEGLCLIVGDGDVAVRAAEQLSETLGVTLLLADGSDIPLDRRFDTVVGKLQNAVGALGGFEVRIDGFQEVLPGGRGAFGLSQPKDGVLSECDVILDISKGTPLFNAYEKREGYLRADPANPTAVAAAVVSASQMVGTFEKPLYVKLEEATCAHSRASKSGCSNCLNICPTGAITPNGDHVSIDPMICAGCGGCSAVCPSGAISYDAPSTSVIFRRISTLASTYRKAGGKHPRLLVIDQTHGREMVSLAARFGRGLPADVLPLEVEAIAGFGHAECLAALASGFVSVDIVVGPRAERDALERELPLARAIAENARINMLEPGDPDALAEHLYDAKVSTAKVEPILPIGTRRQVARLAAKALNPEAGQIELPQGAPYGAVLVDTEKCTLCLSCVSLCPSGALGDNPDLPQLRFQEDACLQCGLCTNVCPEQAISLLPQMNLDDAALSQRVLHEEEPFACVECGALFGVKSTVERIVEKLEGKHSMFGNADAVRMIQMCDNCRVEAQFHRENNPMAGGERPRVRTTDDYYSKRKDH